MREEGIRRGGWDVMGGVGGSGASENVGRSINNEAFRSAQTIATLEVWSLELANRR